MTTCFLSVAAFFFVLLTLMVACLLVTIATEAPHINKMVFIKVKGELIIAFWISHYLMKAQYIA